MTLRILNVEQDGIQLVLHFYVDSIPDLAYVNQQLLSYLKTEYDNNLGHMIEEANEKGTLPVFFMPEDDGSVSTEMWDALCIILNEYVYTLKDARDIIQWMEECVKMEDVGHVYAEILEGATC